MEVKLTQNGSAVLELAREGQSKKVVTTTKIYLEGQPKAVVAAHAVMEAVKVDTNAIFVATPDGILHRKVETLNGVQYIPEISHYSFYPK